MPSKLRLQRIGTRIQQELSEMLIKEIQDPRLDGIFITDVKVDRELAFANIYVSAVEGQQRSQEILQGLHHARSFIRHELAARVELRSFPQIRFHWDPTPERADYIEKLLAEIREDTPPQDAGNFKEDPAND